MTNDEMDNLFHGHLPAARFAGQLNIGQVPPDVAFAFDVLRWSRSADQPIVALNNGHLHVITRPQPTDEERGMAESAARTISVFLSAVTADYADDDDGED